MEVHADGSQCKPGFLCRNQDCKDADTPEHHFNLCPNAEAKKSSEGQKRSRFGPEGDKGRRKYTKEQEDFFGKLSPELANQCRNVFSNTASRAFNTVKAQPSLLGESRLQELPGLMMLVEVTANAGQKIGTLIDLASDTNYITHKTASRLNLKNEEVTLVVHGVGGMEVRVETKPPRSE